MVYLVIEMEVVHADPLYRAGAVWTSDYAIY